MGDMGGCGEGVDDERIEELYGFGTALAVRRFERFSKVVIEDELLLLLLIECSALLMKLRFGVGGEKFADRLMLTGDGVLNLPSRLPALVFRPSKSLSSVT